MNREEARNVMLDLKEQHINVEIRLALDMAIEALKAQEEGRLIEGDCEHCVNTYGTLGCCSTVSNKWIYNCKSGMKEYAEALKAQEWTPCSERPPEEKGEYFITYTYGVDIAEYNPNMYGDLIWSRDNILFKHNSVTAWMPLPKPYKSENEDKA